ncbi:inner membrane protein [Bacteroidales bacterium]|nr:inner membrane protein [Bacteroidales bacterium]
MWQFVDIIEFAGTFAFAISGIRLAAAKQFDWFGALVIGLVTAVGGGTIRDLMLNVTPFWMMNISYLACTSLALLVVVVYRQILVRHNYTFFTFDTIGLALFTVVGVEKTLGAGFPYWVALTMGTITGSAGGMIRDTLINEIPLVFRKELYAIACLLGGLVYWLSDLAKMPQEVSQISAAVTVIVVRLLAVKYHISLPKLNGVDKIEEE